MKTILKVAALSALVLGNVVVASEATDEASKAALLQVLGNAVNASKSALAQASKEANPPVLSRTQKALSGLYNWTVGTRPAQFVGGKVASGANHVANGVSSATTYVVNSRVAGGVSSAANYTLNSSKMLLNAGKVQARTFWALERMAKAKLAAQVVAVAAIAYGSWKAMDYFFGDKEEQAQ